MSHAEMAAGEVEALRAELRRRDDLLRMMAHDLKTPLTALGLQMPALDGTPAQRERARRVLDRNIRRLAAMLDDFLDMVRLNADALVLHRTPMDLAETVEDVAESHAALAHDAGLTMLVRTQEGLHLEADERRVHQVLVNLVSNAIRYTPKGGAIELRADLDGPHARVVVRDDGNGMDEEQQARLFQPFGNGPSPPDGSCGLGLYLARAVAASHGGSLEVRSPGLGQGTTATLR
ncbi:MAG TPA: HAMP domain-containing sensor histidine kinase, partial [Candidatus Thermoplasmatota archaeon]|nr:HAMP domain-containing sensor histidine kinase [Candidatus Thermoplasmatota archaeon]